MRLFRFVALASLCCVTLAAESAAQDLPRGDSVIRAAPVRVDAVRLAATAGAASALLVQLDSLRMGAAASLEQVMRALPLVTVRTNSRGEAQFSLRGSGSDARQVAVLLDGVPLHIGWDDRVDLSMFPAGAAASLSVVRGLPSVLHGPNVLGGVIEMGVTSDDALAERTLAMSADLSVDNAGSHSLSGAVTAPFRTSSARVTVRGGAGYRDRPGFVLPRDVQQSSDRRSSPLTGETLRDNTDHRQVNGFLAGRYDGAGGMWASFATSASSNERGIAAELHRQAPRFWRYPAVTRALAVLSAGAGDRASPFGGRADAELSVGYDAGDTEIVSYTSDTYTEVADTEDADDRTLTLRVLSDQSLLNAGELRVAFTYVDTRHGELLSGIARNDYRQRIWSGGAETAWRVTTGIAMLPTARISIGGALDGADTPESGDKPSIGTLSDWGVRAGMTSGNASGTVLVHAGLSRRARFPSLRELYSGALGRFEPNPGLRAEALRAAEAGLTWRPGSFEVQGVGFLRVLDDAIEQINLDDGRRQRVNLGAVRSAGVELLGSADFGEIAVSGDMTLQRVRLDARSFGRTKPEYQPSFLAGVHTRINLPLSIISTADLRHVGQQYCLDPDGAGAGDLELSASTRYDVAIARAFTTRAAGPASRLEIGAALDNVLDTAVYDQCGLPQPGRTLRLRLTIR